jgi:hypothetical protein
MHELQPVGDPLIVMIHRERGGDHADEVTYWPRRLGEGGAQAQDDRAETQPHAWYYIATVNDFQMESE